MKVTKNQLLEMGIRHINTVECGNKSKEGYCNHKTSDGMCDCKDYQCNYANKINGIKLKKAM